MIGSVKPIFNGQWQNINIDLPKLLGNKDISSSLIVTDITLLGSAGNLEDVNIGQSMWIDECCSYKTINNRYAIKHRPSRLHNF